MPNAGNELRVAQNKFVNVLTINLTINHGTSDPDRARRMELQRLGGNRLSTARIEVRSARLPGLVLRHDRDQLALLPNPATLAREVVGAPRGRQSGVQVHDENLSRLHA